MIYLENYLHNAVYTYSNHTQIGYWGKVQIQVKIVPLLGNAMYLYKCLTCDKKLNLKEWINDHDFILDWLQYWTEEMAPNEWKHYAAISRKNLNLVHGWKQQKHHKNTRLLECCMVPSIKAHTASMMIYGHEHKCWESCSRLYINNAHSNTMEIIQLILETSSDPLKIYLLKPFH